LGELKYMTIGDNDIIEKLVQMLGDADIHSFVWVSPLYWIGYVNKMGSKSTVSQVINNNPQGSRIRRSNNR